MSDEILNSLAANIYSDGELRKVTQALKEFYEWRYFSSGETDMSLHELLEQYLSEQKVSSEVRVHLKRFIASDLVSTVSRENLYQLFDEVLKKASTLPHMVLFVSIHLEPEHIKRIGDWLRANVAPNLLISFKHDAAAVGGCSFVWEGKHYDFSLRYFVDKERSSIVHSMNEYYAAKV